MPMKSHREGWFLPDAQGTEQHKPQIHFNSLLWEVLLAKSHGAAWWLHALQRRDRCAELGRRPVRWTRTLVQCPTYLKAFLSGVPASNGSGTQSHGKPSTCKSRVLKRDFCLAVPGGIPFLVQTYLESVWPQHFCSPGGG